MVLECGTEFCEEETCLTNLDVTEIARRGAVNVSILVGPLVEPLCTGYNKKFAFQAVVEISYVVSGTPVPSLAPSTSLVPTSYDTPRDVVKVITSVPSLDFISLRLCVGVQKF